MDSSSFYQTPPAYGTAEQPLQELGYEPIPITLSNARVSGAGKRPAPREGWQQPTPARRHAWERMYAGCGVGLLSRSTPACDIDILDPAAAEAVESLARRMLGDSQLCRIGRAPKRLLVYRTDSPFKKIRTAKLLPPGAPDDADAQAVEILADGQQFVAFGVHPGTGQPYRWTGATPLDLPAADLPLIDGERAAEFIEAAQELLIREFSYRLAPGEQRKKPKKAAGAPRPTRGKRTASYADSIWRNINDAALADLDAWVPALVPGAHRQRGGYRAVARWRNCTNANVGIHSSGIYDFGGDAGLTPINLVLSANGWTRPIEAARALAERLGIEIPDATNPTKLVSARAPRVAVDAAGTSAGADPAADAGTADAGMAGAVTEDPAGGATGAAGSGAADPAGDAAADDEIPLGRKGYAGNPTYPANEVPKEQARALIEQNMKEFFSQIDDYWEKRAEYEKAKVEWDEKHGGKPFSWPFVVPPEPPGVPSIALPIGVGLGKSYASRKAAIRFLTGAAQKARGERAIGITMVPNHLLSDESSDDFNSAAGSNGPRAKVYKGRGALDPRDRALPKGQRRKACHYVSKAEEISRAGGNATALCEADGKLCPFHPEAAAAAGTPEKACYHFNQVGLEPVDMWFMANNMLFRPRPKGMPKPLFLIMDEAFHNTAVRGFDPLHPSRVTVDALRQTRQVPERDGEDAGIPTQRLGFISALAIEALARHKGGPLIRNLFVLVGLTTSMCDEARRLEYRRKLDFEVQPGGWTNDEEFEAAKQRWSEVSRLGTFWSLLAALLSQEEEDLSPYLELVHGDASNAGSVDCIHLRWKESVHPDYADVPVLIMDATMSEEITRQFFPSVRMAEPVSAVEPHVRRIQICDRVGSKNQLIPDNPSDPKYQTRWNNMAKMHETIRMIAHWHRGRGAVVQNDDGSEVRIDVLVICQQGLENAMKTAMADGSLPQLGDNVEIAHFNNIAGLDRYGGVSALIRIGRVQASERDVERLASVLAERVIAPAKYVMTARNIRLRSGGVWQVWNPCHPDPFAQAVLAQIREANSVQADGRGRGVNRTADLPLSVYDFSNICLPGVVDEVTTWDVMMTSRFDDVWAPYGFIPLGAAHLHKAFPLVWKTEAEADHDLKRNGPKGGPGLYRYSLYTDVAPLSAAYRLKGGRGSLAKALIDGTRFQTADAACTALEALLGPVSHFELAGGPNAAAEDNPSERAAEAAAETAGANQGATPAADPTPDPSSSPDPDPAPAPETPHEPAPAPEPEPTGIPPKTMNDIRTIVTETLTLHKNRQRLADLARRLEAAKPAERGNVCTFTDDIPFDLPAAPPAAKPKKPPVPPLPPRYRGDTLMGWSERAMNALMAGGLDYRDAVPIVAKAWPLGGPGPAITVEDDRERALGTG